MPRGAEGFGYADCRVKLGTMALAIIHRQAVAGIALLAGHGEYGRGIESA
jgi:hypothetical protein